MKRIYKYKDAQWLDLLNPSDEELKSVASEFALEDDVVVGLLSPSMRHTLSFREEYAFLILHFPAFKDTDEDAAYELDFVIGKNFLITVHYHSIPVLEHFTNSLDKLEFTHGRNGLFFGLFGALMSDFDQKLSEVDHWVRDIEKHMFSGEEKKTIFDISEAARHLIDFRNITAVYKESLTELKEKGKKLFDTEFVNSAQALFQDYERLEAKLERLSIAVKELRETNSSIVSTKQNESMKVLTIFTIIATVIVGLALFWVGWRAI